MKRALAFVEGKDRFRATAECRRIAASKGWGIADCDVFDNQTTFDAWFEENKHACSGIVTAFDLGDLGFAVRVFESPQAAN